MNYAIEMKCLQQQLCTNIQRDHHVSGRNTNYFFVSPFIYLLIIFFAPGNSIRAQHTGTDIPSDSLASYLVQKGPAAFLQTFPVTIEHEPAKEMPSVEERRELLLRVVALDAVMDTISADKLREQINNLQLSKEENRDILRFLYTLGNKSFSHARLYHAFHEYGAELAAQFGETRARFSFLQQIFSHHQITQQLAAAKEVWVRMQETSKDHPYLRSLSYYYKAILLKASRQDSCIYYYQKYIDEVLPVLGKTELHFLNDDQYQFSRDSGIVAGAYQEYATYMVSKGKLVDAGRLLINSAEVIPASSKFSLHRMQNHIHLSSVYHDLANPEMALRHALAAVQISEDENMMQMRQGRIAYALGKSYLLKEDYASAGIEFEKAYTHSRKALSPQDPKKRALYMAINSAQAGEKNEALHWLDTARQINCEPDMELDFLIPWSESVVYHVVGQDDLASASQKAALASAQKHQMPAWIMKAYYQGYRVNKANGQSDQSLRDYESYVHWQDSVYRDGQQVAFFETETAYKTRLQAEQIAQLEIRDQAQTAKVAGQRRILLAGGFIILLLSALSVIYVVLNRRLREQHRIITKTVHEKNILLREIHHRVKNNLQVISSLLKLQSGYIQDQSALQALAEGRSRVQSMALLHQNLYQEENLTGVNMKDYFDSLIDGLFYTYNISTDQIRLVKQVEPLSLDIDTVIPLGLITNELISNALRHAFTGRPSGNLFVSLFEADGKLHLEVKDDGIGYTSGQQTGFGTKLIQSLAARIEADVQVESGGGTKVTVMIREYKKAA